VQRSTRVTIHSTQTSTALLSALRDARRDDAWNAFDARYRPILEAMGRQLGLRDTDAVDAAQETLVVFLQAYARGEYDRSQGRLRSWLLGIARHRIAQARTKARRGGPNDPGAMEEVIDEQTMTDLWLTQRRAAILRAAIDELRATSEMTDRTISAFERLVQGAAPAVVADELGMSRAEVYVIKNRVAQRLRDAIDRLERTYDDGPFDAAGTCS